ncbi:hypothetical protein PV458_35395 [Streptomyces sp. MN03-5084-2B]|nr:hypothetical protein [Streptomyces sp. MN03-5084-2B]
MISLAAGPPLAPDDPVFLLINTAVIVVVAAIVIVSQFSVREVRGQTFLWVALLVLRGLLPPGPAALTTAGIVFLVVGLVVSALFGVFRGRTMPMWRDDTGKLVRKGGRTTLVLWILTLVARLGLGAVESLGFGEPFNSNALWLGVGVTLGVQQWIMLRRAPSVPDVPRRAAVREADAGN